MIYQVERTGIEPATPACKTDPGRRRLSTGAHLPSGAPLPRHLASATVTGTVTEITTRAALRHATSQYRFSN